MKRGASFAYDSFNAVERVTKRLEQLKLERMERLRELARYRTLQEEAEEVNICFGYFNSPSFNSLQFILTNLFFNKNLNTK